MVDRAIKIDAKSSRHPGTLVCAVPVCEEKPKTTASDARDESSPTSCTAFLARHAAFLYYDRAAEVGETRRKKAASWTKHTCPACGLNAWAKPGIHLICGDCSEPLAADMPDDGDGED